ncbi:MAG: hypothetical protein ACFLMY_09410 [Candidatus Brachytrichaceae bacterium NZ_4S206]|jgi:hypothetical protein
MQWLIARYQPTSLFSLKHGDATSTGGKSLLVPTPFAIRMALLDVAIRTEGIAAGPRAFEQIKSLRLAIRPPAYAAVTSTFVKILKPERDAEARGRAMQQTIAFREYVHLAGELALAFGGPPKTLSAVEPWLRQVNYFGKRGSFMQLLDAPQHEQDLPKGFILLSERSDFFPFDGTLQMLDDCAQNVPFEKVNIYSRTGLTKDDRPKVYVVLPYRLKRSSRSFTFYEAF